jgi:hypothetical protein
MFMSKAIISLKDTNNMQLGFVYKVVEETENTITLVEEYESVRFLVQDKSKEDYKEIKDYALYEEYIELICGDGYETKRGFDRILELQKVFMKG